MSQERNFGVVEARVGLSLLTCLLIALGYVVLQRLGQADESPFAEMPSGQVSPIAAPAPNNVRGDLDQPQILTAQGGEATTPFEMTAQRYYGHPTESSSAHDQAEITIGQLRRASHPFEAGSTR